MILRLLLILLVSGCTSLVDPVEVIKIETIQPQYHPPLPSRIATVPVEWTVLTPATMTDYLADLEAGNAQSRAFYGLTAQGYQNLSTNMAEIRRYITQLKSVTEYYRDAP